MAKVKLAEISFDEGLELVARRFEKQADGAGMSPPLDVGKLWSQVPDGLKHMLIGGGVGAAAGGGLGLLADRQYEKDRRRPLSRGLAGALAGGIGGAAMPMAYHGLSDIWSKAIDNPNTQKEISKHRPPVVAEPAQLSNPDGVQPTPLYPYAGDQVGKTESGKPAFKPPEGVSGIFRSMGEMVNPTRWYHHPGQQLSDWVLGPDAQLGGDDVAVHATGAAGAGSGYSIADWIARRFGTKMGPDAVVSELMKPTAKGYGVPESSFNKAYSQLREYGQNWGKGDAAILKDLQSRGAQGVFDYQAQAKAELDRIVAESDKARTAYNAAKNDPMASSKTITSAKQKHLDLLRQKRDLNTQFNTRAAKGTPSVATTVTPQNVTSHVKAIQNAAPKTVGGKAFRVGGGVVGGLGADLGGRGVANWLSPANYDAIKQRYNDEAAAQGKPPITDEEMQAIIAAGATQ